MRPTCLILLAALAVVLAACGGAKPEPPPGSPDNPVAAQLSEPSATGVSNEGQASGEESGEQPSYEALLDQQSSKPRTRFTPCNLVTKAEARAIVGAPIREPVEAPQGPTCNYMARTGDGFISLAVQSLDFREVKDQLQQSRRFEISDRRAYCGHYGQPMLYVPLPGRRVLTIGGPCAIARQFAAKAVPRLKA
jgi:hypothetical protein